MPISVSGIGVRMTSGRQKAAELRHHQDVDAEDRNRECGAHVAEGDVGDLPFPVPEQRGLRFIRGLAVKLEGGLRQGPPIVRIDPARDLEHAVDRRLVAAGELCHHHVGEPAVAAEDRGRARLLA